MDFKLLFVGGKAMAIFMTDELLARCGLFADNLEIMRDNFKWEASQLYSLCANIYTKEGIKLDSERIKEAKEIIKSNTSFFSNFRSVNITIPLATLLSIEKHPKQTFAQTNYVYTILKEVFSSSAYLVLAAYKIVKSTAQENYNDVVNRTRIIFDMIKREHFFLTSSEDCLTAVQFALCAKESGGIIAKSEECFEILKPELNHGNTVQAISNTLAFSDKNSTELTDRTLKIINRLKEHGYKLTSGVELSLFGALAISSADCDQIVNDILEVNAYLLTVKGFGNVLTESMLMDQKLMPKRRLINSAYIVLNEYTKLAENSSELTPSEINAILFAESTAAFNIIISNSPSNV